MIIIGLTGGIGSGKTTIAKYIKSKKIPIFDSDLEVELLYKRRDANLLRTIKKIAKSENIVKKNKINKKLLGDLLFKSPKKLKILEKIIFKKLDKKRTRFLKKNNKLNKKVVVLDTPLLFENRINLLCDFVITTSAPLKKRLFRVLKRPGMTKIKAERIMSQQMPERKKIKLADFVVQTSKGKWYTKRSVEKIIKEILLRDNND